MSPKDDYDYENNATANAPEEETNGFTDMYDEKTSYDSVGSIGKLFIEDEFTGDYKPPSVSMPTKKKKTTATVTGPDDDDFLDALSKNRQARGDRSRPAVAPKADKTNPAPRPAIRARVPVVREPVPSRRVDEDVPTPTTSISDDVSSFKSRYSDRDALGTARDPGSPDREARTLHPVGAKPRTRTITPPPGNAFQGINPLRWVALGSVIFVLVIMVVLTFNNSRLRRDLYDLRAASENGTPTAAATPGNGEAQTNGTISDEVNDLNMQLAIYSERLEQANSNIGVLEDFVRTLGYDPDHAFNPPAPDHEPPPTAPDVEPEPEPAYVIHIVASGENLSRIAQLHYGSALERYWRLIAVENNIPAPYTGLQVNQPLRIPRNPYS